MEVAAEGVQTLPTLRVVMVQVLVDILMAVQVVREVETSWVVVEVRQPSTVMVAQEELLKVKAARQGRQLTVLAAEVEVVLPQAVER